MTLQEAKKLNIGDPLFYNYEESEARSYVRECGNGDDLMDLPNSYNTRISEILLPTKHVRETSNMVTEKRKEFSKMNFEGARVNPDIFKLFVAHWVNMCNAEDNNVQYKLHKEAFEKFIKELFEVARVINNAVVGNIPYLRR